MKKIVFLLTFFAASVFVGSVFAMSFENPTPMYPRPDPHGVAINPAKKICTDIVDLQYTYNGTGFEGALLGTKIPRGWRVLEVTGASYLIQTDHGSCLLNSSMSNVQTCCEQALKLHYTKTPTSQGKIFAQRITNAHVCTLKTTGRQIILEQQNPVASPVTEADCSSIATDNFTYYYQCVNHIVGVTTNGIACSETYAGYAVDMLRDQTLPAGTDPDSLPSLSASHDPTVDCPAYSAITGTDVRPASSASSSGTSRYVVDGERYAEYRGDATAACATLGYTYVTASDAVNRTLWSNDGLFVFGHTFSPIWVSGAGAAVALVAAGIVILVRKKRHA